MSDATPRSISSADTGFYGISTEHESMPNGELRFRLRSEDGSSYIRTESSSSGAWQNSHYHTAQRETYVVQNGWVALAELIDGELHLYRLDENDVYTTRVGVSHNLFMPAKAVTHTVKHGGGGSTDWNSSPELDGLTKHLTEDEVLKLAK